MSKLCFYLVECWSVEEFSRVTFDNLPLISSSLAMFSGTKTSTKAVLRVFISDSDTLLL